MKKYIASDIDGTILPFGGQKLPDEVVKAIKDYQKFSGNRFTICTGRGFDLAKDFIDQLDIKLPVILSNGAVIYDPIKKEFIDKAVLPLDKKKKVLEIIKQYKEVRWSYSSTSKHSFYVDEKYRRDKNHVFNYLNFKLNYQDWDDFEKSVLEEEIFQFGALYPTADPDLTNIFKSLRDNDLDVTDTAWRLRSLEISGKDVNKFRGIKRFSELMNIDIDDICTIGDNNNDLSMLKNVKNSFAVANAIDEAIDCASEVIDSVDNCGVAKLLNEFINGER